MSKTKTKYYSIKKVLKLRNKRFVLIMGAREGGKSDLISRLFEESNKEGGC